MTGSSRTTALPAPPRPPITLGELADALPGARLHGAGSAADAATPVTDVTHDSTQVAPGALFAARPGARADGHDFAAAAVDAGAAAVLVERPLDLPVPQLVVESVAEVLGHVAARVHGEPSHSLALVGVTGTNGKTTSTYLLEAALRAGGHSTGLIGTVETRIRGEAIPGVRTTPEATDLQRLLRRMVDGGVTAAAMEVSSHGLALGRVHGTRFSVAVFTNLSQDHLDFHSDLEDYFAAKASLFGGAYCDVGIVNVDDPWGARLAAGAPIEILRMSRSDAEADVVAEDIEEDADGSRFTLRFRDVRTRVDVRLPGHFNVLNAAGAVAAAAVAGVDLEAAAGGVGSLAGVPGRMEPVQAGQPFGVLVDYAHTPDSLENVLRAARRLTDGRIIVVVGCGGDRDRGKRPLMGRAAAALADVAVLTSDNPRSEDPRAILDAMVAGAGQVEGAEVHVEVDRRAAIAHALADARPGDVVVLAGKGHETYQELADRTIAFDDRAVAAELLSGAAGGTSA